MEDKEKVNYTIPAILISTMILIFVVNMVFRYDSSKELEQQKAQEIKSLQNAVNKLEDENWELKKADKRTQLKIEAIIEAQTKTLKKYEDAKNKLLQNQESFKSLPSDSRDSILRQYIRANQQPYRS